MAAAMVTSESLSSKTDVCGLGKLSNQTNGPCIDVT